MADRVRRMTASELERILKKHGFALVSQKGSHRKWRNETKRLQVVVPLNQGRSLPLGTLVAILKGAEVPESEWKA
jgi:predicted RNA binding protein YcfA (HicA-like mRNA interferase family)